MAAKSKARNRAGRSRDVETTKQRLLDAVGRLLSREGFTALGVNAIADEASTDKVLIYRYFGGYSGLLEAFAQTEAFWPTNAQLVGEDPAVFLALPPEERLVALLQNYVRELRRRQETQAILAWELVSRNELTSRLEEVRERRGLDLLALFKDTPRDLDLAAVLTIVSGAIHYLLVRARSIHVYLGIDLRSDEGWARIESAIALFVRALLERTPSSTPSAKRSSP